MNPIATAVKHLIAAGVTGDALVTAINEIEEAAKPKRTKAAERTAKWRAKRHGDVTGVTCDVKKEIPHTPLEKTTHHLDSNQRAREGVSRGTRLPADWQPAERVLQQARNLGLTEADITDQLERFRDWANAATGQVSIKRDWNAALRNWLKRVADDRRKHHTRTSKPTAGDQIRSAFDDLRSHIAGHGSTPGHGQRDGP